MSISIVLDSDREKRLKLKSEQAGKPVSAAIEELIDTLSDAEPKKALSWGSAMWKELAEEGFTPIWQDLPETSVELAQQFKAKAEGRRALE